MKVLVACAGGHGSTAGTAERIAGRLGDAGLSAEARPVAGIDDVDGYDGFVIGPAVDLLHWLQEATRFVRRHRAVLAARPVWLFSSGPLGTDRVAGTSPGAWSSPPVPGRSWRSRFRTAWAVTLTGLLGVLFTGLTAVTVALWATDPGYSQTNPVVDLAFFVLGGILVTAGFASQIRTPRIAGLQQALLTLVVLAAAGWFGGRVEPFVGALVLLAAAAPLVVLHPERRRLLGAGAGWSKPLAALAAVGVAPAVVYAAGLLDHARAAGPSCFLGQCAQGDRYCEAAALALAAVAVVWLAAAGTPGWLLAAWSSGAAAVVLGGASLAFPDEVGALSGAWAATAVLWGGAVVAVAHVQRRAPGQRRANQGS